MIINLRKDYYPLYKTDVFVEVSDEVAEALLLLRREENNRKSKMFYHKAYFSLDCEDGIENAAIGWEQPSPEDYMIQLENEADTLTTKKDALYLEMRAMREEIKAVEQLRKANEQLTETEHRKERENDR